jgi:hypothetical protein
MLVDIVDEDSYSEAASHRINDCVDGYIPKLLEIGSIKQYRTLFYGEKTKVQDKLRVVSDFAQIQIVAEGEQKFIEVTVAIEEILERVLELCAEAAIEVTKVNDDPITYRGEIPKPSDSDMTVMLDTVDRTASSALSLIGSVKGDTLQRLRAAMDREYIEPLDAKAASTGITKVHVQATEVIKVLRLKKRMDLLGKRFQFSNDEEQALVPLLEMEKYQEILVTEEI